MPYARRTDANHAQVRDALRACGWVVADMSGAGKGFADLVAIKHGRVVFVEVKDGTKPPSDRRLTPAQVKVHEAFLAAGAVVKVVTSIDDAVRL